MQVKVPFKINDSLRKLVGREYHTITSVSGRVNANGITSLGGMRYDTTNSNRNSNDCFMNRMTAQI